MEVVDAVGSVLQIAQVGAQLSLDLFKISQSVGSRRDVQHFAKDIALFSTILKDLGNTLAKGKTSKFYREDAYHKGSSIAKECKEVFEEIQDSLNKYNKNGGATPPSTKRVDKQIFRKSQPQLLRGKLEFLRSNILLQVAVLSYAEKASASPKSTENIDGLLALKSLVLANEATETAFQELCQELSTKGTEGSSLGNPISISDNPRSRASTSTAASHQSSPTAPPTFLSIAQILHGSKPTFPSSSASSTSDFVDKSLAQKREATRQAVDHVNLSSMAIERPYGPQNLLHAQPVARSESRQTHLTVPANVAMPRRASSAMNPPPKFSSISEFERRSFDTNPQIKVETDRPRSIRESSTSMAISRPPSVNVISEEDHAGRSETYRPTETSQRSSDDANFRQYAGAHLSAGRDNLSASPRIHGPRQNRQYDSPTGPNPSLLPSPTLKRKSPKEESLTPTTTTSRQPENAPDPTSMQEPWQWFESEKHDKTSQTVRDLLKKWTYLDLGDEDPDAQHRRGRDEDEEAASRTERLRVEVRGAQGEISRHRRGDDGGGGGGTDGGVEDDERAGDGGAEQRKRLRRY